MTLSRGTALILSTINGALSEDEMIIACPIAHKLLSHDNRILNFGIWFWQSGVAIVDVMEKAATSLRDPESVAAFLALLYVATKLDYNSREDRGHFLASANAGLMQPICDLAEESITDILEDRIHINIDALCLNCVARRLREMCHIFM